MAKTALYGEANAYAQTYLNDDGSAMQLYGHLSEFGFRNTVELDETIEAYFDVAFGFEPLEFGNPNVNDGEVGIRGSFGQVSLFYGQTPLGKSNDMLQLMERDPDSLYRLFSAESASIGKVPVGLSYDDGIMYQSPEFSKYAQLAFALLPSEQVGGEPGFSVAGTYDNQTTKVVIGVEFNTATESDQLIRMMGQSKVGAMTLGGGIQVAGNSELNTSARSFFAFGKMPLFLGQLETQAKLMGGFNRLTNIANEKSSEFYISFVDQQQWAEKVSTYGFSEWHMRNGLEDRVFTLGTGLRIEF